MNAIHHDDGVYTGLSLDEYLADDALGSSDLKKLAANPPDAKWERRSNPLWDEPKSDARALGSLVHVAVLEGLDVFDARYAAEPEREQYPGALDTNDELKGWLRDNNVKPLTGAKADLVERIRASGLPHPPLWSDVVAKHVGQREQISAKQDRYVRLVQSFVKAAPDIAELFTGGMCELSLFWTIEHKGKRIRCKARPDYTRPDGLVDLKKFGQPPQFGRDLQGHLQREAANYGYPVQAQWHLLGVEALTKPGRQVIASSLAEIDAVRALLKPGGKSYTWVFVRTPGAPCGMALDFGSTDAFGNADPAWLHAERVIEKGLDNFVEYSERFGDRIWLRLEKRRPCDSYAWPLWMSDGTIDGGEITV